MAKTDVIQLGRIGHSVWQQYQSTGDFAIYQPNNPDSDGSGMFHVKLADWDIAEEEQHPNKNPGAVEVTVKLRRKGVDDQGRTGGQDHGKEAK